MLTPILPHQVYEGGDYWASWGSKGWTAVRITSVRRKFAEAERINPKTNEPKSRGAKVRIDELVARDPKQKGADKPEEGPAEVFASVRRLRESAKADSQADDDDAAPAQPAEPEKPVEVIPEERLEILFAFIDDESTTDDW